MHDGQTAAELFADDEGFISGVDGRFEELLGWTRDEIVGKPITTIIPQRFRDAHHLGFARFLLTGEPTLLGRPLALWMLRKDGTELRAEHVLSAERVGGHWVFRALIRPLTREVVHG